MSKATQPLFSKQTTAFEALAPASIAVAYGDGIGPEIMKASLHMLQEAGAQFTLHPIEIGEKVYLSGEPCGISKKSWEILQSTQAFYKSPITTPQGGGFKSLNVTVRAALGLFANVRPCVSYSPFVKSHHSGMNLVIIRENEEDLYTGVEYRPTYGVVQAIKMLSYDGCERIIRYAFEYAKSQGRKKVTCFSKDNILKMTDGLFHRLFDEIGSEYPDLEKEHWIIDIGSAKLADTPEQFDVIVTANLYGDIISDIAAQIAGSVGLAGSANIGLQHAMFEAIHGSAPRRAGQNKANPSGLLMGGLLMLDHLGQQEVATRLYNAWARTIEEGIHTYDIYKEGLSKECVGTWEFAQAVCARLGQNPNTIAPRQSIQHSIKPIEVKKYHAQVKDQRLLGMDLYLSSQALKGEACDVAKLAHRLQILLGSDFELKFIANRGITVWPHKEPSTLCIDQWRCRIMSRSQTSVQALYSLASELAQKGMEGSQIHLLYEYEGKPGFTLGQDDQ